MVHSGSRWAVIGAASGEPAGGICRRLFSGAGLAATRSRSRRRKNGHETLHRLPHACQFSLLRSHAARRPADRETDRLVACCSDEAAHAAAGDGGWPRGYVTATGARVVLYQPQVESWPDQKKMTLYAAVLYQPSGAPKPALGTIKIESDTRVALAERLVNFSEFTITESSFPTLDKDAVKTAVDEIKDAVPRAERVIALDRVLASVDTSQITPRNVNGVRSDPPLVFVSQRPAVLVNLDGDPIWSPIAQNDLKFAVNTNWDLFQDPATSRLYLRVEKSWLSASSIKGPWTSAHAARVVRRAACRRQLG